MVMDLPYERISIGESEEQINKDFERAEEYSVLASRSTFLGHNKFELSTGLIIAARFADKIRRVAIVSLRKWVPKDIIIRDVSALNKELYEEIVNKRKMDKLDIIKVVVDVLYDEVEKKLRFSNIRITRYYPEEQCTTLCKERVSELEREISRIKEENKKLKESIEKIKSLISS
ncbi:MAG: DUF2258 domain-containing protein [Caldisphaeraceae archaeon]|nr:DUF2258 domain-containing protein [Caldisphaeraceae archaeon]